MYGGYGQQKYDAERARAPSSLSCVGFIEHPERLVKIAEDLLESRAWEEMVVGLALLSGRCLPQVLKTGVVMPKTDYSLVFTAYQELTDQVLGPFELPTLGKAQQVLDAWQRVRTQMPCEMVPESEIGERYRTPVLQCAKKHFARRIPVSDRSDWYTPLYAQIYPLIAMYYYCPQGKESLWFQQAVCGSWSGSSSSLGGDAWYQQVQLSHEVYYIGDGKGAIDRRQGLKLDQEGVTPLEWANGPGADVAAHDQSVSPQTDQVEGTKPVSRSGQGAVGDSPQEESRQPIGKKSVQQEDDGAPDLSDEAMASLKKRLDAGEVLDLSDEVLDALEDYLGHVFVEKEAEKIRSERAAAQKSAELGVRTILTVSAWVHQRLEDVMRREGASTPDGAMVALLDGYDWLHRGGALPQLEPPQAFSERFGSPKQKRPQTYVISQTTYERLAAFDPDQEMGMNELEEVIERLLDTYEWLVQGGLSKQLTAVAAEEVWSEVEPQVIDCIEEISDQVGDSFNGTLVWLVWMYDWFYASGLSEQIKDLASVAISFVELDERDRERISQAMSDEEPEDRFNSIQSLYLGEAKRRLKQKSSVVNA